MDEQGDDTPPSSDDQVKTDEFLHREYSSQVFRYPEDINVLPSDEDARKKLVCPECLERGVTTGMYSAKSRRDRLIHDSHCSNEDCDNDLISPDEIRKQLVKRPKINTGPLPLPPIPIYGYRTVKKISSGEISKTALVIPIIFTILIATIAGFTLMGSSTSTSPTKQTTETAPDQNPSVATNSTNSTSKTNSTNLTGYSNQTKSTNNTELEESKYSENKTRTKIDSDIGSWSIYTFGDESVVAARFNRSIIYLQRDGNVSNNSQFFRSTSKAVKKAVDNKNSSYNTVSREEVSKNILKELNNRGNWTVSTWGNRYVVASQVNGEIRYLWNGYNTSTPALRKPYYYDTIDDVKSVITSRYINQVTEPTYPLTVDPVSDRTILSHVSDIVLDDKSGISGVLYVNTSAINSTKVYLIHKNVSIDREALDSDRMRKLSNVSVNTTRPNGAFVFENVAPGKYTLYVKNMSVGSRSNKTLFMDPVPIEVNEGGNVEVLKDSRFVLYYPGEETLSDRDVNDDIYLFMAYDGSGRAHNNSSYMKDSGSGSDTDT